MMLKIWTYDYQVFNYKMPCKLSAYIVNLSSLHHPLIWNYVLGFCITESSLQNTLSVLFLNIIL